MVWNFDIITTSLIQDMKMEIESTFQNDESDDILVWGGHLSREHVPLNQPIIG